MGTEIAPSAARRRMHLLTRLGEAKPRHLSKQHWDRLSDEERSALKDEVEESGVSWDDYEAHMKKMWPKEVVLPTPYWRKVGSRPQI